MIKNSEWYHKQLNVFILVVIRESGYYRGVPMFYRLFPLFLLISSIVSANDASVRPVTIVELFTSQGCYSCPPADELLGELDAQAQVITLSCHVTYWNYLGWKDTFSRPFCNNRQRQYQRVLKGGEKGVYTPQMVINGRYGAVGSRRSKVEAIIAADHQYETSVSAITLNIKRTADGSILTAQLPEIRRDAAQSHVAATKVIKHHLFLFGTTGKHLLPITSGENGGKQLTYINPIEYVANKGEWNGRSQRVDWFLPKVLPQAVAIQDWVVVAQQWPLGEIIAAGTIDLSTKVLDSKDSNTTSSKSK
ncbi:MAG: hypothetical protein ACJA0C_000232 [Candidatus Endobugula sp.]|jgi:hypothetical protein